MNTLEEYKGLKMQAVQEVMLSGVTFSDSEGELAISVIGDNGVAVIVKRYKGGKHFAKAITATLRLGRKLRVPAVAVFWNDIYELNDSEVYTALVNGGKV